MTYEPTATITASWTTPNGDGTTTMSTAKFEVTANDWDRALGKADNYAPDADEDEKQDEALEMLFLDRTHHDGIPDELEIDVTSDPHGIIIEPTYVYEITAHVNAL